MKKIIVRGVFSTDTPRLRRHFLTDDLLSAIEPGRVLALGTVWDGSLRPLIDAAVGALKPLITGFTSGRTLHSEMSPATLDLGRRWCGELRSELGRAVTSYARDGGAGATVELSPVAAGVKNLQEQLESGESAGVMWALDGLKSACEAVDKAAGKRTGDAGDWLTESDGQSRQRVASMNAAAASFWRDRSPPVRAPDPFRTPTGDAFRRSQGVSPQTTEVRNLIATANKEQTSMPAKIDALNAAAKAFWAPR